MSEETALRHAKICFLSDESLLKQAAGVVYKGVLQGGARGGHSCLKMPKPPFKDFFIPFCNPKVKLLIDGPRLVFRSPDFRIIRITSSASSSLAYFR